MTADSKPTELATATSGAATLATVRVLAVPAHVNDESQLKLYIEPSDGFELGGGSDVTVGAVTQDRPAPTRTVTQNENDEDRVATKVKLSAYFDETDPKADTLKATLEIEFADAHALPPVKLVMTDKDGQELYTQPTSVKEGESIYVKANVVDEKGKIVTAREGGEALTIKLAASGGSADGADIETPAELEVATGGTDSGTTPVKVEIRRDEDVGTETLVLAATVSGSAANGTETKTVPGVLSIDIDDATETKVEPKSDEDLATAVKTAMADAEADGEGFNPGESFTVTGSDLFEATEGYTFSLGFSVSGDADAVNLSSTGGGVTVTAKQAGEATVTFTATARASSATGSQDVSNVAHVDIPVTVTNKKLVITLAADPAESVDEGGTITLTAEAIRDILKDDDATVALNVIGSVDSPPESFAIPVGEKMATAVLTVKDDSVVEAMQDITILASGTNLFKDYRFDIQVVEDDMATTYKLTASAESVAEGGTVKITATASQAVLENTEIALELGPGSADDADYDLAPSAIITIAEGGTEGMATLTATADDGVEGEETLTLNAMMGNVLVGSVTIAIEDTDVPPVVEPTIKAEEQADVDKVFMDAGADWTVGDAAVTVDMSDLFVTESTSVAYSASSDNTASVATSHSGGNMLTLTPGEAGDATIKVTATDEASGDVASASSTLTVALQDLTVEVTADSMAIDEGEMATITAMANRKLVAGEDVTLSLTVVGDAEAVDVPGTLTIAAGMQTGTATVEAVQDDDTANANVTVVVSGSALGGAGSDTVSLDFAITDDDRTVVAKSQVEVDATFVLAIGGDFLPGDDAATLDMGDLFMVEAGADLAYEVASSDEASVMISDNGSMLTLTPGETGTSTITVTATDSSGDADDTATVSSDVTVGVLPLKITSVTASATDVMEGDTVEITAMANKAVETNVEVRLMRDGASTAGADDIKWDATAGVITIMAGDSSGKATLTATDDTDTEPAETLTLLATHEDLGQVGTVMITIAASDPMSMFTLSGPMDTNLVEGQSYELTVTADPAVQEDTEVPVMRDRAASDADDADFTVAAVMLKAGDASGTTMLMVADDGMDDSGHGMPEALVLYIADGGADQRLSFNLWDAAVPALPVIAQLLLAAFLAIGGYRRYLRR